MRTLFAAVAATVMSLSAFAFGDEFAGVDAPGLVLRADSTVTNKVLITSEETVLTADAASNVVITARVYAPADMLEDTRNLVTYYTSTNEMEWTSTVGKWKQVSDVRSPYFQRWYIDGCDIQIKTNVAALVKAAKHHHPLRIKPNFDLRIDWDGIPAQKGGACYYKLRLDPETLIVKAADNSTYLYRGVKQPAKKVYFRLDKETARGMYLNEQLDDDAKTVLTITNAVALDIDADGNFLPKTNMVVLCTSLAGVGTDERFAMKSSANRKYMNPPTSEMDYRKCPSNELRRFISDGSVLVNRSAKKFGPPITKAALAASYINGRLFRRQFCFDFNRNGRWTEENELTVQIDPAQIVIGDWSVKSVKRDEIVPMSPINPKGTKAVVDATARTITFTGDCAYDDGNGDGKWKLIFSVKPPSFGLGEKLETLVFTNEISIVDLVFHKKHGLDLTFTNWADWDGLGTLETKYTTIVDIDNLVLWKSFNKGEQAWPMAADEEDAKLGDETAQKNLKIVDATTLTLEGVTADLVSRPDGKGKYSEYKADATMRVYLPTWAGTTNQGFGAQMRYNVYTNGVLCKPFTWTNVTDLIKVDTAAKYKGRQYIDITDDLVLVAKDIVEDHVATPLSIVFDFCWCRANTPSTSKKLHPHATFTVTCPTADCFTLKYPDGAVAYPLDPSGAAIVTRATKPIVCLTNNVYAFEGAVSTNVVGNGSTPEEQRNTATNYFGFALKLPESISSNNWMFVQAHVRDNFGKKIFDGSLTNFSNFGQTTFTNVLSRWFSVPYTNICAMIINRDSKDRRVAKDYKLFFEFDFDLDRKFETRLMLVMNPTKNTFFYQDTVTDLLDKYAYPIAQRWPLCYEEAVIDMAKDKTKVLDARAASGLVAESSCKGQLVIENKNVTMTNNVITMKIDGTIMDNYGTANYKKWDIGKFTINVPKSVNWRDGDRTQWIGCYEKLGDGTYRGIRPFEENEALSWKFTDMNLRTQMVFKVSLTEEDIKTRVTDDTGTYILKTFAIDWYDENMFEHKMTTDADINATYQVKIYLDSMMGTNPAHLTLGYSRHTASAVGETEPALVDVTDKDVKDKIVKLYPISYDPTEFVFDFMSDTHRTNYTRTVTEKKTTFDYVEKVFTNKFDVGTKEWKHIFRQRFTLTFPKTVNAANWKAMKVVTISGGAPIATNTVYDFVQRKFPGEDFKQTYNDYTITNKFEWVVLGRDHGYAFDFDMDGKCETVVKFQNDASKIKIFRNLGAYNGEADDFVQVFPSILGTQKMGAWKLGMARGTEILSTLDGNVILKGACITNYLKGVLSSNRVDDIPGVPFKSGICLGNETKKDAGSLTGTMPGTYVGLKISVPEYFSTNETLRTKVNNRSQYRWADGADKGSWTNIKHIVSWSDTSLEKGGYVMWFVKAVTPAQLTDRIVDELANDRDLTVLPAALQNTPAWAWPTDRIQTLEFDWDGDGHADKTYTYSYDISDSADQVTYSVMDDEINPNEKAAGYFNNKTFPINWTIELSPSVTNFFGGAAEVEAAIEDGLIITNYNVLTSTFELPKDNTVTNWWYGWKLTNIVDPANSYTKAGSTNVNAIVRGAVRPFVWEMFKDWFTSDKLSDKVTLRIPETNATWRAKSGYTPIVTKVNGEDSILPLRYTIRHAESNDTIKVMRMDYNGGLYTKYVNTTAVLVPTNRALVCKAQNLTLDLTAVDASLLGTSKGGNSIEGKLYIDADTKIIGNLSVAMGAQIIVRNGATLTLDEGTTLLYAKRIKGSTQTNDFPIIVTGEGSKVVIGKKSVVRAQVETPMAFISAFDGATVELNGVVYGWAEPKTVLTSYYPLIRVVDANAVVNEGAFVTNTYSVAIGVRNGGSLTLNGGRVVGAAAVHFLGDTLTVPEDSTVRLIATGAAGQYAPAGGEYPWQVTGEALIVDGQREGFTATVAGGRFWSKNAQAIGGYNGAKRFVSNGLFGTNAKSTTTIDEALIVGGYTRVENKDEATKTWYKDTIGLTTYTLKYNLNGGTMVKELQTAYTIKSTEKLGGAESVTRENWDFAGWVDADNNPVVDFTDVVKALEANDYADVTVKATWQESGYKYTLDEGDVFDKSIVKVDGPMAGRYSATLTIDLPTNVTCKGYTFLGWYNGGKRFEKLPVKDASTKDITLEAKWIANTYEIAYKYAFGNEVETSYNVTNKVVFNANAVRDGFTLDGWYLCATNAQGTVTNISKKIVSTFDLDTDEIRYAKDITVTAVWIYNQTGKIDAATNAPSYYAVDGKTPFAPTKTVKYYGYAVNDGVMVGTFDVQAAKVAKKTGLSNVRITKKWLGEKAGTTAQSVKAVTNYYAQTAKPERYYIDNNYVESRNSIPYVYAAPAVTATAKANYTLALRGRNVGISTLRISLNAKGKASVAITLPDNTKWSCSAQAIAVGEDILLPIAYQKVYTVSKVWVDGVYYKSYKCYGGFTALVKIGADGSCSLQTDVAAACSTFDKNGVNTYVTFEQKDVIGDEVDGAKLEEGTKYTVVVYNADASVETSFAAKVEKSKIVFTAENKKATLSYNQKTGALTGSFKYQPENAEKVLSFTVTGVMPYCESCEAKEGFGTATTKNRAPYAIVIKEVRD